MRSTTLTAVLLSAAACACSTGAVAQMRTEPAGRLFFEGDIVRHIVQGQIGPWCVLQSRFKRGEGIAWRLRALLPDGSVATDAALKSVVVELGSGDQIPLDYGPHGDPPTDYFWSNSWIVPANYPTGSLGYKVIATLQDDAVVIWEPFTRPASQLTIVEGEPALQAATQ